MSFFRAIFARTPRPSPEPWTGYGSPRAYASALMRAGIETERRRSVRRSKPHFNRIENARELAERRQEALEYRRDVSRDATAMAADKLLREVGVEEREDDWLSLYYLE